MHIDDDGLTISPCTVALAAISAGCTDRVSKTDNLASHQGSLRAFHSESAETLGLCLCCQLGRIGRHHAPLKDGRVEVLMGQLMCVPSVTCSATEDSIPDPRRDSGRVTVCTKAHSTASKGGRLPRLGVVARLVSLEHSGRAVPNVDVATTTNRATVRATTTD
jgi:hypothetical protein